MQHDDAARTTADAGPLNTGLPYRYTAAEEARALDRLLADLHLDDETPKVEVTRGVAFHEFKPAARTAALTQAA